MNFFYYTLILGSKLTSALSENYDVFCCSDKVTKSLPRKNIEILSKGTDKECTLVKWNSKENIFFDENLHCIKVISEGSESYQNLTKRDTSSSNIDSFFNDYQEYHNIEKALSYWNIENREISTFKSIGKSHMKKEIFAFEISTGSNPNKQSIWINGGIHAREWLSPAAVLYTIKSILYNKDKPEVKDILDHFNFYFKPLSNPDGYMVSFHRKDWRKNVRENGENNYGVDLNRNWNDHWELTKQTESNDKFYRGPFPHSEPEVQALANYSLSIPNRMGSLDIHSFGQLILRNWGWTTVNHENEERLKEISKAMEKSFKESGYTYKSTKALYLGGKNGGALDDWMASVAGFKSFTIELPPKITSPVNMSDFQPPKENILPVSNSLYKAVLSFAKELKKDIKHPIVKHNIKPPCEGCFIFRD